MFFSNANFGEKTKVFLKSLFNVVFDVSGVHPPLLDQFRVDNNLRQRITNDGASRVTNTSGP